jgi:integrase
VALTALQAASVTSQNQGMEKGEALLGCQQQFLSHQPRIYLYAQARQKHQNRSLRHTYAYLLKTSGVHVTTAQKLMGHADPGVTLGIYTRFRDEEIDNAGAAIMDSLRGKSDYLLF